MGRYLLGIDSGTSVTKAALFDLDGKALATGAQRVQTSAPQPTWSEVDMEQAWQATAKVVRSTVQSADITADEIVAVGVTGAMVGAWIVDRRGHPVRPAILWDDCRTQPWIEQRIEDDAEFMTRIFNSSGSVMQQGCTLPVIRWLLDHEPAVLASASTVFGCKDWLRFRLTGAIAADPTEASVAPGDARSRARSDEMLTLFGLDEQRQLFPRIRPSESLAGRVSDAAAEETCLNAGTPVAIGAGDVACSILGAGASEAGTACTILGTNCLNCLTIDRPVFTPADIGLLFTLPGGKWLRAMVNVAGTTNLDWFVEQMMPDFLASSEDKRHPYAHFESLAVESAPGAGGVIYHPYLGNAGITAPVVSAGARGQFSDLTPAHDRADLLRAVYEGVCFSVRDCYDAMEQKIDEVLLVGGGARSDFWCQLLSDISGYEVAVPEGEEFGAKGAALLAGVAAGAYESVADAVARTSRIDRRYRPDQGLRNTYDEAFARFRAIREAMMSVW